MPIDVLPDDVLLDIFDFCANEDISFTKEEIEAWQTLVHVCRRWRAVVFGSTHRLNLRLCFTPKTPARDTLDVWPALPLLIRCSGDYPTESVDNIIAVLECSDRVSQIEMTIPSSYFEKVLPAMMQEPFPELTTLKLELSSHASDRTLTTVLPDSFLGGSAPRLRSLVLDYIPFPGLPKILLSATDLVDLLCTIPHSGYISPESMATGLSVLTRLEFLSLTFQSPRSRPDRASRRPPPRSRSTLFSLTEFLFTGVSEYLDDLVARINAPQLFNLMISFFNQIIFDTPHFIQFISRTPSLNTPVKAHITIGDWNGNTRVALSSETMFEFGELTVLIRCRELDWQLSALEQFCTSSLPPLSTLETLSIEAYGAPFSQPDAGWQDNVEKTQWLELLRPFVVVKDLYITEPIVPCIVSALQELVGGRAMEVLPTLQNIFLQGLGSLEPPGPVQEGIGQFIAARQVTNHPIAVSGWPED